MYGSGLRRVFGIYQACGLEGLLGGSGDLVSRLIPPVSL